MSSATIRRQISITYTRNDENADGEPTPHPPTTNDGPWSVVDPGPERTGWIRSRLLHPGWSARQWGHA
jgi:hypothetical protein